MRFILGTRPDVLLLARAGFGRIDAGSVASSPRNGQLVARFQFWPDIVSHRSIQ